MRAPFPYFGSKRLIAHQVWAALGNPSSYCEPFGGSAAVLLGRPKGHGRTIETYNDSNGLVTNFWRSVRHQHDEVASLLDYPVSEIDLHSRHRWLVERMEGLAKDLDEDPDYCDCKAAAWWAWGISAWIGSGWCSGKLVEQIPELKHGGSGVHARNKDIPTLLKILSQRLRRTRLVCGDWRRVLSPVALCHEVVKGDVGVFLDPPYFDQVNGKRRSMGLYGKHDSKDIAGEAAKWALQACHDFPTWKIVLAGYEGEHDMPGWHVVAWDPEAGQWNSGGYGRKNGNSARERLWLSPACNLPSLPEDVIPGLGW